MSAQGDRIEPFFLHAGAGERFCLFHPPAGSHAGSAARGAVLYIHPFAEEMNRARRMAALQARALAQAGYGVLQLDLHGCGDSSGDFADARWEGWREDLAAGAAWLAARTGAPLILWGLRLGGALALDHARQASSAPAAIVLWQPVLNGRAYLNQFLRLRVANDMLGGAESGGTAALRAQLAAGVPLEVAGYELHPRLAAAIDALDPAGLVPPTDAPPIHWFEVAAAADRPLAPAVQAIAQSWQAAGVRVEQRQVAGPQFWATPETAECPELVAVTTSALLEHADAL